MLRGRESRGCLEGGGRGSRSGCRVVAGWEGQREGLRREWKLYEGPGHCPLPPTPGVGGGVSPTWATPSRCPGQKAQSRCLTQLLGAPKTGGRRKIKEARNGCWRNTVRPGEGWRACQGEDGRGKWGAPQRRGRGGGLVFPKTEK